MFGGTNRNTVPPVDPGKLLKYALAVGAGLLVLWIFVLTQSESRISTVSIEEQARIDSLRVAIGRDIAPVQQERTQRMFSGAFTTFLILIGAIGILWWYFRSNKTIPDTTTQTGLFIFKGRQSLPGGQEIQVIEINGEYWVLAVNHGQTTLLHRFKKEEWDLIVKENEADGSSSSFAGLLSHLQKK